MRVCKAQIELCVATMTCDAVDCAWLSRDTEKTVGCAELAV